MAGAESSWRRMAQSQVGKWHTGLLPGWNTMHFLKFISEMQQCRSSTGAATITDQEWRRSCKAAAAAAAMQ